MHVLFELHVYLILTCALMIIMLYVETVALVELSHCMHVHIAFIFYCSTIVIVVPWLARVYGICTLSAV